MTYVLRRWPARQARLTNPERTTLFVLVTLFLLLAGSSSATPPNYQTFGREQRIDVQMKEDELLRIWVVYVAQGDGILIQLPRKLNSGEDTTEENDPLPEQVDILVDGGSSPASEAWRIGAFLSCLYPGRSPSIEHTVITHHDQDHIAGLTVLLNDSNITFTSLYHNGLASYRAGHAGFPETGCPSRTAVCKCTGDRVKSGMAYLDARGFLDRQQVIADLSGLRRTLANNDLEGEYETLAQAVVARAARGEVSAFDRVYLGAPFIAEREASRGTDQSDVTIDVLWPVADLRPYGNRSWSKTINGNSVTFRLTYGDFAMLFTGDLNGESEEALLDDLAAAGKLDLLQCDVLKVPHHGSADAAQRFFTHPMLTPVISAVSVGDKGFKSKAMSGSTAWEHPSPDVIKCLGGAHRVYSTYTQEKKFKWSDIRTESARQAMIETTHVVIETDGRWFRIVEIPADSAGSCEVPPVTDVRRGDGTQWIRAK